MICHVRVVINVNRHLVLLYLCRRIWLSMGISTSLLSLVGVVLRL